MGWDGMRGGGVRNSKQDLCECIHSTATSLYRQVLYIHPTQTTVHRKRSRKEKEEPVMDSQDK